MKKICFITTVHPPFDTRIFHKEAKTLANADYDVSLIVQYDEPEVKDGIKLIPLPNAKNRFFRIIGSTCRAFQLALKQRADIYHFHDPELIPVGLLLKLLTGTKVIYDVHEDVPKQISHKGWIPVFLRKPVAKGFNYLEKFASIVYDEVITATEDIADNFTQAEPVVIHNFPRLEMLPDVKESGNTNPEKNPTLVYVGGITKNRGIKEVVEALGLIDDGGRASLDLIGKFQDRSFQEELERISKQKHINFLGWLEPDQVYEHLRKSDIGIVTLQPLPRYRVALPVKLFEYMAAGLPVIASNFPLWREIINGNNCGLLVNPENPEDIAEAIEYLISHPDEGEEMGQNGRRAVEDRYNWEKEGAKLLNLYVSLMD